MIMSFLLIRVPNKRNEIDHIYYKQYQTGTLATELGLKEFDPNRTIYAVKLASEINAQVVKNIFSSAGKIEVIHTGQFTNKHNNKKKRKTYYFALVVYATEKSLQRSLDRDKLQKEINRKFKDTPALISLPSEEIETTKVQLTETEEKLKRQRDFMEEGGFTLVEEKHGESSDDFFKKLNQVPLEPESKKKKI